MPDKYNCVRYCRIVRQFPGPPLDQRCSNEETTYSAAHAASLPSNYTVLVSHPAVGNKATKKSNLTWDYGPRAITSALSNSSPMVLGSNAPSPYRAAR